MRKSNWLKAKAMEDDWNVMTHAASRKGTVITHMYVDEDEVVHFHVYLAPHGALPEGYISLAQGVVDQPEGIVYGPSQVTS